MIERHPVPEAQQNLFAEERRNRILDLLAAESKVTVSRLVTLFRVTGATIRSDLRELEHARLLTRTHGGAISRSKTSHELNAKQKQVQHLAAKRMIGQAALELVEDGDTLILDTGTTTLELAHCLHRRERLTVVTNDVVIAQVLEEFEAVKIIFMGGLLRNGFHCTIGILGRAILEGLSVDKAFMGANGFTVAHGATTPDVQQAETKKMMAARSAKTILLCDRTKIGRVSLTQFLPTAKIDTLVTDALRDPERRRIERAGIEVVLAS
jgi:DeoR family fructose operon transcriptional repressor